jgi:L-ascorbate metabolism protein UlaG (beta-lactamase superfamily)
VRLYHAGDTDYLPELERLGPVDIALIPIDGDGLTMSTQDAARLVNDINAAVAVPMHYSVDTGAVEEFRLLCEKKAEVVVLDGTH